MKILCSRMYITVWPEISANQKIPFALVSNIMSRLDMIKGTGTVDRFSFTDMKVTKIT